jgi:hypothetical protein
MARQTSIDCYNQIKAEGLLAKRQMQVYESMLDLCPCTAQELEKYINNKYNFRGGWKQLSVLRDSGVIYENRERECTVTGRNVIEWDLTDKLPKKTLNAKTTKQKIVELKLMIENLDNSTTDLLIKMELNNIKEYINNNFNK